MVRWWKHFCLNDKKKIQFCNLDGWSDYHVADIITPTITDTKPSLLYFILFLFFWVLHLFLMICLSGLWKKMKKNEKNVLFLYFCLFSLKENARKKNIFPITVKNLFIGRWEWQYINLFFLANVIRKNKKKIAFEFSFPPNLTVWLVWTSSPTFAFLLILFYGHEEWPYNLDPTYHKTIKEKSEKNTSN